MNSLLEQAQSFISTYYQEAGKSTVAVSVRMGEITEEIHNTDTYTHTFAELEYGAKLAWRNSNRCIGRLFWNSLTVVDHRHTKDEKRVFQALSDHLQVATNQGKIRPTITIFPQNTASSNSLRIWNHQLLRYAGYKTERGWVGDPASYTFTRVCEQLGWEGKKTSFDLLPWVIQMGQKTPQWLSVPQEHVLEVPLTHPEFPWFEEMQLRWYAVPILSDMKLVIGGIEYPAAPFNGWYMGTEIGARNLADEGRYYLLPRIAKQMGLNTSRHATLWKDRALIELNAAVLTSFKNKGVTIVDHHTAAQQFKRFEQQEQQAERKVTGDWDWLIPPISPATTPIWHKHYDNTQTMPNFLYQPPPY